MKIEFNLLLLGILFSILFTFTSGCIATTGINVCMDAYYHAQYPMIENEGNNIINNIVADTRQYGSNSTRLIKIADHITKDFTDIYWPSQQNEKYFCYYSPSDGKGEWIWCAPYNGFFGKNPRLYGYITDKRGGVRTILSNELAYNPEWIAYQKTGACEALSIFFNETANRSGFVTRMVRSDGAFNCGGHTWNEVLIDGEWKYYDVQLYGQIKNSTKATDWFGNQSDYGIKSGSNRCDLTKYGVYVFTSDSIGYGENLTQYYDPLNECPHGVHYPNDCN